MTTTITRDDVDRWVRDTLPWDEPTDWDIDGIIDAVIDRWPVIGPQHVLDRALDADDAEGPIFHIGGQAGWFIDQLIDDDEYRQIVKEHQRWESRSVSLSTSTRQHRKIAHPEVRLNSPGSG